MVLSTPVLTLKGNAQVSILYGQTYTDAGATASDSVYGDLTSKINTINPVNTSIVGTYIVRYDVTNPAGNSARRCRKAAAVYLDCGVKADDLVILPKGIAPPKEQ